MSAPRRTSIRRRQMLAIVGTSAITLFLACVAFAALDWRAERRELVERVSSVAEVLAHNTAAALDFQDAAAATETIGALRNEAHVAAVRIYDRTGAPFAEFSSGEAESGSDTPTHREQGHRFEGGALHVFQPIEIGGDRVGMLHVIVRLDELRDRFAAYAGVVVAVFLAALLVALALSNWLARRVTGPVLQVARAARTVAARRDYATRVPDLGGEEVGQLVDAFNAMLTELQRHEQALQLAHDDLERRVEERTRELALENAERRRAEHALQESEQLYRQMAMNASDLLVTHEMGSTSIRWFGQVEAMLGLPEGEFEHTVEGWMSRVHPDDLLKVSEAFARSQADDTPFQVEYRIRRSDDTWRFWESRGRLVRDSHGQPLRFTGACIDITARKQAEAELAAAHRDLIETSRRAGMAEVATGVLHNVGNVLNSVNVSATLAAERARSSGATHLQRAVELLREHASDLPGFFARDPRALPLIQFLEKLSTRLAGDRDELVGELEGLRRNVEHIKEIVSRQQSYARVAGVAEAVSSIELVEDALQMNASALARHRVTVVREFESRPELTTEKHRVLQILVNLIQNAKQACTESEGCVPQIRVRVTTVDRNVQFSVADNGVGITPENLTRIFAHGFTTRRNGHGFGLHSGALAARELRGRLFANSDGPGRGATFTLELPISPSAAS